ncbi:MAG: UDP-N-acetylglucosamine 2-epimerase, partial [Candidatus Aenigmatarchaeota archaeon]
EINRVLTDHISTYLFCPTQTAVDNLKKEGIKDGIYNVGDVMYDVALEVIDKIDEKSVLEKFMLKPKEFVLVTIHRAENTDNIKNFMEIWEALNKIASDGIKLFFPVHPRTKKVIQNLNLTPSSNNLILNEPISYFEMVALEKNASVIITDSGGVQKEGYFFGTPCVVVREETEWVELVNIKFNSLSGINAERIIDEVKIKLNDYLNYKEYKLNLYGDGTASDKIIEIVANK